MTGRLIVFEGIDGSGKSTQVRRLAQRLDFDVTFQFGATDVGSAIRLILLDPHNDRLDDRTEALLIIADKAQHVSEIVRPALASGRTVISDRYCASTLAYQGYGRGLDRRLLDEMMQFATQGLEPDLTVLLDIDVTAALERLGDQRDRIERAGIDFYQQVRNGYLKLASQHSDSWVVVDADGSVDEVAGRGGSAVDDWLSQNS